MKFKELPSVKDQIKKCVRCGRCRTVCPIFAEIKNETAAPRGHVFMVQMLRDGVVEPDNSVYERLGNCLLCETCSTFCPSGIDIHELNAAARSYITEQKGSPGKHLIFDKLWCNPALLRMSSRMMWGAQTLGLQKLARTLGLTQLLPGDLPQAEKILTQVPRRSAREQLKEINPARGERKLRVGYFLGCGTDLFNPEVALGAVKFLTHNGCEVVIPRSMKCCGLPHVANGKLGTARELLRHNIREFSALKLDYIVTDCASCSSALSRKNLQFVLGEEEFSRQGIHFADQVVDLTVFLLEILKIDTKTLKMAGPFRVTYHDPCHLAKAQNIRQQPRELLKLIPGVELVEMVDADRCCGGSGTFSLTHYDLSSRVLDKKMENIKATECEVVATCCPSCTMQLQHGMARHQYPARVLHPVELLARAY